MAEPLRRWFEALILLLLAVGFVAAALAASLAWPLIAVVGVALALRVGMLWRGLQPRLSLRGEWGAFALLVPLIAADVLVLHTGPIAAGLHLVLCAGLIKLFTAARARDYWYLRGLALLEILAAALLGASELFLPLLALFTFLMIAGLVVFEVYASRQAAVEAAARREGAVAAAAERRLPGRLVRLSLLLSCAVLVLAAGIFMLLPRTTVSGAAGSPGTALSGFSDDVDLGAVAQLQQSDAPVMHIRIASNSLTPFQLQHLLWRGRALAHFDGRRWIALDHPWPHPTGNGILELRYVPYPGTRTNRLSYRVTLAPLSTPVLFYPARLVRTLTRFDILGYDADTQTVSGMRFSGAGQSFGSTSYTGISDVGLPPADVLREAPAETLRPSNPYLSLPPALDPRIARLAGQIAGDQPDNWDRISALRQYLLSGRFAYTLDNLPQGPDPLATFLFQARAGDCEYFATALAVMGRTLGIPTRLVNGFELGPYNPISGEYIVEASQAHSWVEAWFPAPQGDAAGGRGSTRGGIWVPFDATPPAAPGEGISTSRAAFLLDALTSTWQEWVVSYDWIHQATLAHYLQMALSARLAAGWNAGREAGAALATAARQAAAAARRGGRATWAWGLLLAALLAAAMYWGRRLGAGGLRPPGRDPAGWTERQAQRLYRRFQARLRRAGIARSPAETAEELLARVPPGAARAAAARFVADYLALRFDSRGASREQRGDPRHCCAALAARLRDLGEALR